MAKKLKYWVVGADFGRDISKVFLRRGYWEMGYDDEDQPTFAKLRDKMMEGDRIAMKRLLGSRKRKMKIIALGLVKEVSQGTVYVDWVAKPGRDVPVWGFLKTIHPPVQDERKIGAIFRI